MMLPEPLWDQFTVPVGLEPVMVAVHVPAAPAAMGDGEHTTTVLAIAVVLVVVVAVVVVDVVLVAVLADAEVTCEGADDESKGLTVLAPLIPKEIRSEVGVRSSTTPKIASNAKTRRFGNKHDHIMLS